MAIFAIPIVPTESNLEQQVVLDGVTYTMRVLWNGRSRRYYMSLEEADGTPIITGRKIVADAPWAYHDAIETRPPGTIWVITTDPQGVDPGLRDLGARAFLGYVS